MKNPWTNPELCQQEGSGSGLRDSQYFLLHLLFSPALELFFPRLLSQSHVLVQVLPTVTRWSCRPPNMQTSSGRLGTTGPQFPMLITQRKGPGPPTASWVPYGIRHLDGLFPTCGRPWVGWGPTYYSAGAFSLHYCHVLAESTYLLFTEQVYGLRAYWAEARGMSPWKDWMWCWAERHHSHSGVDVWRRPAVEWQSSLQTPGERKTELRRQVLFRVWQGSAGSHGHLQLPGAHVLLTAQHPLFPLPQHWLALFSLRGWQVLSDCIWTFGIHFDPWAGQISWRRERLPTPVFWPGEFHGLCSPWGRKELDMTERLSLS